MYTYETQGNGLCIAIYKDGNDIAFLQGDEAGELCNQLDACETDEQKQYLLSQYDYE